MNTPSKKFLIKTHWVLEVILRYSQDKKKSRFFIPKSELENNDRKITFNETLDVIGKINTREDGLITVIPHAMPGLPIKSRIREMVFGVDDEKQDYKSESEKWEKIYKDNLEIEIKSIKKLTKLFNALTKDGIPFELFDVYYNPKTGVGYIEERKFKFKNHQPEFFVFSEMYRKIGSPIPKMKVLELSRKSRNFKNPSADMVAYFTNELTKKMRERTGLNTMQIANNNGDLTLVCRKVKILPKHP